MADDKVESELKSEIAKHKPRDEEGHFVHVDKPKPQKTPKDPVSKFFAEHASYHKSQDDILDVHVGNPLHKIVKLLEEIKQQKAFSFTLKGSLGIAGVALALSVFGILGAGNLLCDKGVQSEIGVMKVLNVSEKDPAAGLPVLSNVLDFFNPKTTHNRVVLVKENEEVIKVPLSKEVDVSKYKNYPVIATGNYDACSKTLKINDQSGLEVYVKSAR